MRRYVYLILLSISLSWNLFAQTTISGIVTDASNLPVPFASVYLSKTTIGSTTNNEGLYLLTIPQNGEYEMIASYIGYNSGSTILSATGKKQVMNIKLTLNTIQLDEITVSSKARKRVKNYTEFIRLLLGETENAQTCTIHNIEDLFLYEDPQTGILKGRTHKPLQIENRALGYNVMYDLTDFIFDAKTGLLKFTGGVYFQPQQGSTKNMQKWIHNRLSAYYGSKIHFLRALFADSLRQESYKISDCMLNLVRSKSGIQSVKSTPVEANSIHLVRKPNQLIMYSPKPLYICYFDNHPELASEIIGYDPKKYESTLEFSDSLKVFPNGYFKHPYAATWGGEMGNERIADMLPFDFVPDPISNTKSNSKLEALNSENTLELPQKITDGRDQVFVQLDRNIYRPGDTIFFKAFIKDRISGTFKSKSVSMYALLFDEKKMMVDSSRFKIFDSSSSGWMVIPEKSKSGKYRFAAFTSMMQNDDPAEAFQLEIQVREPDKILDRVAPISNADKPVVNSYFELRYLPEGGTFIDGIRQRVGFNATNGTGQPVYIEGLLKNSSGVILDSIKSGSYGPGSFSCLARPGLVVDITKGAGPKKTWPLPVPSAKGISLSVAPIDESSFVVAIESNSYSSEPMTLAITMDMTQVYSKEITLNKKQQIVVETDQLPSGIAEISLLGRDLWPIANRLYYINSDKHLKFTITPENDAEKQESELSISVSDAQGNPVDGIFSIAVTDSAKGINPEIFMPGIGFTLNYQQYFPGNLPAKALIDGLENMDNESRNLLLLVYGWTKFNSETDQKKREDGQLINFDLMRIKIRSASKKFRTDRKLDLYSLEDLTVRHLSTNAAGEAFLPLDSLPKLTRTVTVMPDVKAKNKTLEAMFNIPADAAYFRSKKLFMPQPKISYSPQILTSDRITATVKQENYSLGEKNIEIQEVIIIGHPENKKVFHDKDEQKYQNANVRSLDIEPLQSSYSLEIALRKLISPYQITTDNIILRPPRSIFGLGGPLTALIVLDGMPIYQQGWAMVKDISPSEVTSLTILNGQQGYIRYGDGAQGGVIFINTRSNNKEQIANRTKWSSQNKDGNMLNPIELYRPSVEFYNPTKVDKGIDPLIQGRATIFWESDVNFNGKEPVKLKYNNLNHTGTVSITINGMSVNNLWGTGRASYQLR